MTATILDGLLLVDKPSGMTSHDVVAMIRHQFRLKKVGHTGTLDPLATGLLVLTIGKGTKLTEVLISQEKDYEAVLLLGKTSDTQDADGKIITENPPFELQEETILQMILRFKGPQEQIPPMYSAVKRQGKKLYELARAGLVVDRPAKKIHIYDIQLKKIDLPYVYFFVSCSKGTYIRTLCHDIGEQLGCGGILWQLRRTRSGKFQVKDAFPLSDLLNMRYDQFISHVIPLENLAAYADI